MRLGQKVLVLCTPEHKYAGEEAMKLMVRLAEPRTEKETLFHLEIPVDDMKEPGIAHVTLEGKEYIVEIHYD